MSVDDIPLLERPAFFHYQRLTAPDLSGVQKYNRELRWLHNRSLHNWGIAFGFRVSGSRGAQTVKVEPGYAIDCVGRDLVLDKSLEMPIPAVASNADGTAVTYYLTISYAEDSKLDPVKRQGECNTSGAVRLPEKPDVRWQNPNDGDSGYQPGFNVILGAIRVLNCQLAEDVSGRELRYAVPPTQPYVAAGRTEPGGTPWQLWPNDKAAIGVATTVATTSAGFQTTPRYQANVVGDRIFQATSGTDMIAIDGYSEIALATASSFELRVILPTGTTVGKSQTDTVTGEDCKTLLSRIATANALTPDLLLKAFSSLIFSVGLKLSTASGGPLGQLTPGDFQKALTTIAGRNRVTKDALLNANGWQSISNAHLSVGQIIAVPGSALPLNRKKDLKPSLMDTLTDKWHVVWMGVEG